jgi:hypothetical protein
VREVLATEMLEALGVETSKSFSLIETGEALDRNDEPSPTRSAVLVRLSHGHIRIGSFQRLAWLPGRRGDAAAGRLCAPPFLRRGAGDDAPARLLDHVVGRTARLSAQYMAAGFVHGVLNSDNINVTGESFDYGPWRFAPSWDPGFTAAYFDHAGLYAFGRQPEAILWDAMQLANALTLLSADEPLVSHAVDRVRLRHYSARSLRRRSCGGWAWSRASPQAMSRWSRPSSGRCAVPPLRSTLTSSMANWAARIPESYGEPFAEATRPRSPATRPQPAADLAYWLGAPCAMLIDEGRGDLVGQFDQRDDWQPLA